MSGSRIDYEQRRRRCAVAPHLDLIEQAEDEGQQERQRGQEQQEEGASAAQQLPDGDAEDLGQRPDRMSRRTMDHRCTR